MRLSRRALALLSLSLSFFLFQACEHPPDPVSVLQGAPSASEEAAVLAPTFAAASAEDADAIGGFIFLPPLGPGFEANDSVELAVDQLDHIRVEVCRTGDVPCSPVATFSSAAGGSEGLRVETEDGVPHFHANWHTRGSGLQAGTPYTLRVMLAGAQAGSIELMAFAKQKDAKGFQGALPVIIGTTIPVKFYLHAGMAAAQEVPSGGGEVVLFEGQVTLDIPQGAFPGSEPITATRIEDYPFDEEEGFVISGTAFDFGPDGLVFQPTGTGPDGSPVSEVQLTLGYRLEDIPPGGAGGLQIAKLVDGEYVPLPSWVDEEHQTVSAPLEGFSRYVVRYVSHSCSDFDIELNKVFSGGEARHTCAGGGRLDVTDEAGVNYVYDWWYPDRRLVRFSSPSSGTITIDGSGYKTCNEVQNYGRQKEWSPFWPFYRWKIVWGNYDTKCSGYTTVNQTYRVQRPIVELDPPGPLKIPVHSSKTVQATVTDAWGEVDSSTPLYWQEWFGRMSYSTRESGRVLELRGTSPLTTQLRGTIIDQRYGFGNSYRVFLPVTVTNGPRTLQLNPTSLSLTSGESATLTPAVNDFYNQPWPGATVLWTSLDPSVANVDSNGAVTATGPGTTTIEATLQGVPANYVSARVPVTVSGEIPGLVAHWKLNGNAVDAGPNGLNGIITDGSLSSTPGADGQLYGALQFPADAAHIRVPHTELLNFSDFTISLWMKPSPPGTSLAQVIGKGVDSNNSYEVRYLPDGKIGLSVRNGHHQSYPRRDVFTPFALDPGTWHHVVAVLNNATLTMSMYVDGVLAAEAPLTAPFVATNTFSLAIGRHYVVPDGNQYWAYPYTGGLDDVRVYGRALTPAEVGTLPGPENPGPGGD